MKNNFDWISSGRIKCHQYWPNVLETNDYGLFSIRCRRERKENQLVYREFLFTNKETHEERIIYQIQTETWPDHGVPNDFASFVEFVLEIRELRKSNKHLPILVHCRYIFLHNLIIILIHIYLKNVDKFVLIFKDETNTKLCYLHNSSLRMLKDKHMTDIVNKLKSPIGLL